MQTNEQTALFEKAGFTRSASYEIFMLAVSLLSFVNLALIFAPIGGEANKVVLFMDGVIAGIFFFDFVTRFWQAESKRTYFFKNYGWSDLLASVPLTAFNLFRIFRVVRFMRVMRKSGYKRILRILVRKLASTALYVVFFLILMLLEFGSIAVLLVESGDPQANITTASDAMWWVFVSITTVGYGDYYPVTNAGRLVGVLTLTVGVGLFGVVTGYLANAFLGSKNDQS